MLAAIEIQVVGLAPVSNATGRAIMREVVHNVTGKIDQQVLVSKASLSDVAIAPLSAQLHLHQTRETTRG